VTIAEAALVIQASAARTRQAFERQRIVANELAHLIGLAFHDPRKLPKYEPAGQSQTRAATPSTEADDALARGYLIHLALRSQP
jgi:hypothetical protein